MRTRLPTRDCACWLNDVFSYQKEIEFEGEIHNGALLIATFLDVPDLERRVVAGIPLTPSG